MTEFQPLPTISPSDTRNPLSIKDPWERLQRLNQYYARLVEINASGGGNQVRLTRDEIAIATLIETILLLHGNISQLITMGQKILQGQEKMASEIKEIQALLPPPKMDPATAI